MMQPLVTQESYGEPIRNASAINMNVYADRAAR